MWLLPSFNFKVPCDVGQGELVGLAEVVVFRLRLALAGNGRFSSAGVTSAGCLPTLSAASSVPPVLLRLAGSLETTVSVSTTGHMK